MNISKTKIEGLLVLEPDVFGDERGYFMESFNLPALTQELKQEFSFIQDNESKSSYGVLRGLHYQMAPYAQTKLVRVIEGCVLDVAVDIRKGSPTFGEHVAVELSGGNKKQFLVPRGFAHGFVVKSQTAIFAYKVDNLYSPEHDRGISYRDAKLGIDWHVPPEDLKLSSKDSAVGSFENAEVFQFTDSLYD
jgi:dTDP-4-dehydrorhamnose 3,5-epimerase